MSVKTTEVEEPVDSFKGRERQTAITKGKVVDLDTPSRYPLQSLGLA